MVLSFSSDTYVLNIDYTDSSSLKNAAFPGKYTYVVPSFIMHHEIGDMTWTVSGLTLELVADGNSRVFHKRYYKNNSQYD